MLPYIDFKPDVIHTNDWQTALVPIYYRLFYANNEWYSGIKTLFTIHNIQYQGQYGKDILEDVFGIPNYEAPLLEYDNCVNLMKGRHRVRQLGLHREPHLRPGDPGPLVRPPAGSHPPGAQLEALRHSQRHRHRELRPGHRPQHLRPLQQRGQGGQGREQAEAPGAAVHRAGSRPAPHRHGHPAGLPQGAGPGERGHRQRDDLLQRPICGAGVWGSGVRELLPLDAGAVSRQVRAVPGLCARALPEDLRRGGHLPHAQQVRALRPVPR